MSSKPAASCVASSAQVPAFEEMESRLMLTAPNFATPLSDGYWMPSTGSRTIGIDGADADGDALTITAVSDNPNVSIYIPTGNRYAVMHYVDSTGAAMGDITVQLFDDRSPTATARFVTLSTIYPTAAGTPDPAHPDPFYSDVIVHRVIPGFMIQTGDAVKGDGTGGSPLGKFNDAFDPILGFGGSGVLAMANSGADTNDCQFFITAAPTTWLNQVHMIFGQVISGMDVLNKIINLPRDTNDRPNNPPKLDHVDIIAANADTQDATITMNQTGAYTTAHVTITLNDGHGGVTTKVITLRNQMPTLGAIAEQSVAPGTIKNLTPVVTNATGLTMNWSVSSQYLGTDNLKVDQATGQVSISVPPSFSGLFEVTVSATVPNYSDATPISQTFYVDSQSLGQPPILSHVSNNDGSSDFASVVSGNYMYVSAGDAGMKIYDVSNPASPILVSTFPTNSTVRDVKVVGSVAYLADTWGGLISVNVADKVAPVKLNAGTSAGAAISVAVQGNYAYVADYSAGLTIYDITNPAAMVKVASISDFGTAGKITQAVSVALKGTTAYISDASGTVFVLNVADPAHATLATKIKVGANTWGLDVDGNRLYVTDEALGLFVYDITNPVAPKPMGKLALSSLWQVNASGGLALAGGGNGYGFIDVSKPSAMKLEYVFQATSFGGMPDIFGTHLALPLGADGVAVVQSTRSVANRSITIIDDHGVPVTLTIKSGLAQVTTSQAGGGDIVKLDIYNTTPASTLAITSPTSTTIRGGITVNGSLKSLTAKTADLAGDLTVSGTIGTLALRNASGQHMIDINGTAGAATITLGAVTDFVIDSEMPIRSLTVNSWTDSAATTNDVITAPQITSLTSKGDFGADLSVTGNAASTAAALGTVKIAGSLAHCDWQVFGGVGSLSVTGLTDTVNLGGSITGLASAKLGDVKDTSITVSGGPAKSIQARRWIGGGLTGTSFGSIKTTGQAGQYSGDFNASLATILGAGQTVDTVQLGTMSVSGGITGGAWVFAGSLGTVKAGSMNLAFATVAGDVKSLAVTGDASGSFSARSLKTGTIRGGLKNATWGFTQVVNPANVKQQAIGSLTVNGWVDGSTVTSTGNVGTVTVGGMKDSNMLLSVKPVVAPAVLAMPLARSNFADGADNLLATLSSLKIKGITGQTGPFMNNSIVAAWNIGAASVISVQADNSANGGADFGLAANKIATYARQAYKWSAKTAPGTWPVDNQGDYVIQQIV